MERSRNALMDVITRGPIALENVHQQSCQGVNGGTGNCVHTYILRTKPVLFRLLMARDAFHLHLDRKSIISLIVALKTGCFHEGKNARPRGFVKCLTQTLEPKSLERPVDRGLMQPFRSFLPPARGIISLFGRVSVPKQSPKTLPRENAPGNCPKTLPAEGCEYQDSRNPPCRYRAHFLLVETAVGP